MKYFFAQRVYTQHTDCQGVVYHANYLAFLEYARAELLRKAGYPLQKLQITFKGAFVVTRLNGRFEKPAFLDDLLHIETKVMHRKYANLHLQQTIYRNHSENEKQCVAKFELTLTWVSHAKKIEKIPNELQNIFN